MRILADADFLVALAKEDDSNHQKALKKLSNLEGATVFTTPFTIPEAVTVLSYKTSHKNAKDFLVLLRKKKFIELPIDRAIISEADNLFLSRKKKGTSWIDCLNVVLVRYYKLDGILSFDKFYKKMNVLWE